MNSSCHIYIVVWCRKTSRCRLVRRRTSGASPIIAPTQQSKEDCIAVQRLALGGPDKYKMFFFFRSQCSRKQKLLSWFQLHTVNSFVFPFARSDDNLEPCLGCCIIVDDQSNDGACRSRNVLIACRRQLKLLLISYSDIETAGNTSHPTACSHRHPSAGGCE